MDEGFAYAVAAANAHKGRGGAIANFVGLDDGVNDVRIFFVIRNANAPERSCRQALFELGPVRAGVGGFINAAAGPPTLGGIVAVEAVPLAFVHCHDQRVGFGGMHLYFHAAGFVIHV